MLSGGLGTLMAGAVRARGEERCLEDQGDGRDPRVVVQLTPAIGPGWDYSQRLRPVDRGHRRHCYVSST